MAMMEQWNTFSVMVYKMLVLIPDEQKLALVAFLDKLAICISEGTILLPAATRDLDALSSKIEGCHRIKSRVELDLDRQRIHKICLYAVNATKKPDCLVHLFDAFASVENTLTENHVSTESEIPGCDQQRILIASTKEAFRWAYNGQHALTAFLEYLDVQWLKMIDEWDPSNGGTLQSRCGTIVQSSCAGKSRLIDR